MKNLIKKSIVLVVLFTTLLVNANEISSLRNLKDEKTTMLTLLNVKKGNQLIMKDAFGKVLYKQSISNSGEFVKGFDLTSLPNGKYYFLLKGDLQNKIIPFRINKNKLEYDKEKESIIQKSIKRSQAVKVVESNVQLKKKNNRVNPTTEIEKGLEDKILNFKGQYFTKYNNKK